MTVQDRQRTPEEDANLTVLWRAYRMHRETGWCPHCRQIAPCEQRNRTRQALLEQGLLVTPPPGGWSAQRARHAARPASPQGLAQALTAMRANR